MKALVWHKPSDIRCEEVPDPKIEEPGGRPVDLKRLGGRFRVSCRHGENHEEEQERPGELCCLPPHAMPW